MGADAAVERHDGTPPGEDEIAARMRAEGLDPYGCCRTLGVSVAASLPVSVCMM